MAAAILYLYKKSEPSLFQDSPRLKVFTYHSFAPSFGRHIKRICSTTDDRCCRCSLASFMRPTKRKCYCQLRSVAVRHSISHAIKGDRKTHRWPESVHRVRNLEWSVPLPCRNGTARKTLDQKMTYWISKTLGWRLPISSWARTGEPVVPIMRSNSPSFCFSSFGLSSLSGEMRSNTPWRPMCLPVVTHRSRGSRATPTETSLGQKAVQPFVCQCWPRPITRTFGSFLPHLRRRCIIRSCPFRPM